MACLHLHLYPARVDGGHTICLDCLAHVIVSDCRYASGESAQEDRAKVARACERVLQGEPGERESRCLKCDPHDAATHVVLPMGGA